MQSTERRSTYELIMTLTTLVFVITSIITVYISLSAWNEERESVRPYLTFHNSPEVYLEDNQLIFSFVFYNVGLHPAASFHSHTLVVDSALDGQPLHNDHFSLVNYIPQNTTANLIIKIDLDQTTIDTRAIKPHYIVINLKYADPILEKDHEQTIYLRWNGIENGKLQSIFHCSRQEKDHILEYIAKF